MNARFVALGLAPPRAAWFTELAKWSTSAVVPVEFVKCVTVDEVRARLASGRAFSALLVDAGLHVVDRDLVDEARSNGCAVVVIDDGRVHRDWAALGAAAVLPSVLTRAELMDALESHSVAVANADVVDVDASSGTHATAWRGRLIAVVGAGGVGTSTVAIAIAEGLARDVRFGGLVLLADLALAADQGLLHDTGDVAPGIQEMVEAHRRGDPSAAEVRSLVFDVADRGYHLLLGLRRHRDWVAVRPRAFDAALDGMRRAYRAVVADLTGDLEGESQCGSLDVEERNVFARTTTARADVVAVVGLAGAKGLHRMVRVVEALAANGVDSERILPVVNRAPRNPRARAELSTAYTQLVQPLVIGPTAVAGPIFLPERRHLDDVVSDGGRVPVAIVAPVARAVGALLDRLAAASRPPPLEFDEPVPVAPGSVGSWTE